MKRWTDDELFLVLTHAPTKANVTYLAHSLDRTPGSIAMVFRWAQQSQKTIDKEKRRISLFLNRIKQTAKLVGWV